MEETSSLHHRNKSDHVKEKEEEEEVSFLDVSFASVLSNFTLRLVVMFTHLISTISFLLFDVFV